jgi:hypothetical protein
METNNIFNPVNLLETRETYEAPLIEMVEVKVEQGFQVSLSSSPDYDYDEPTY